MPRSPRRTSRPASRSRTRTWLRRPPRERAQPSPTPPRSRSSCRRPSLRVRAGNRGAAGAIGLLAALSFAVLYLAVWLGIGLLSGDVTVDTIGSTALAALGTWTLWVPVVVFFIAFWLLGAIINRGRWGAWVIFGLLVGVAAYVGHILGALFQAPFWMLTASEGAALVESQLLAPLAIAAFIIGRELTIWFGAWVAARGARVTELNVEAQREYERTLEAGPQLVARVGVTEPEDSSGGPVRPLVALGLATVTFIALLIFALGMVSLVLNADIIAAPGLGQLPGVFATALTTGVFALVLWLVLRTAAPALSRCAGDGGGVLPGLRRGDLAGSPGCERGARRRRPGRGAHRDDLVRAGGRAGGGRVGVGRHRARAHPLRPPPVAVGGRVRRVTSSAE